MSGLGKIIHARLAARPERLVTRFLGPAGTTSLTAGELIAMASDAAARLAALDLPPRSVVGVAQYSGPSLHAAWLGCLWSGHIPTMIAPPSPRMEPAKYADGLRGIVSGLALGAILVDGEARRRLEGQLDSGAPLIACDDLSATAPTAEIAAVGADEVAVIQHSSGTTGQQKAVALTTAQILAHQQAYSERLGITGDDRIVSWLPLYHDMGFVAAFLQPLIAGVELVEMSPFDWAARPAMLLEAVDAWRPTLCWLPNFAFSLMAEPRVLRGLGAVDLSSVRAWVNCSEPVMATSIDRFAEALAPYGVTSQAVVPSYAMAENVFAVTQATPGAPGRLAVSRERMEREGCIEKIAEGKDAVALVSNGAVLPTTELEVRNDQGGPVADGRIGEFHIRGAHRFEGYHGRPDLTAEVIDAGGWYATGDLGFVLDGEVYVTGRRKDLIILRGRNYRAQDIEDAVGALAGVKAGRVVVFSLPDPAAGTEKLVILAETEGVEETGPLSLEVRKCVAQTFDTTVADVRMVPDRWLVKSTSGKLARADNRAKYLQGLTA